jgi:hypothetical protein
MTISRKPITTSSVSRGEMQSFAMIGTVLTTRDDTVLVRLPNGLWYNPVTGTATSLHGFDEPLTLHHLESA